jgi:hypothetical protein
VDEQSARHRRAELVATILLATAALATAWSTYQSAQWRGDQAAATGQATADHIESSQASTRAGQQTEIDIATFTQWLDATAAGDAKLADLYRAHFRVEFQPAFVAWERAGGIGTSSRTPFELPQYRLAEATRATRLNSLATARAHAAATANQRADAYLLAVVLFATALFFAGLATKVRYPRHREVLVGVGIAALIGGLVWIAMIPITITT